MRVEGSVAPGFEVVRDAFSEVVSQQRGSGAALAVSREGVWIVDLWGGWVNAERTRQWEQDSLVQPYSVSKPFAAMGALVLIDRGLLDLDAPVQLYWPEFRAPASVRQLLSHQAGVVALDDPTATDAFFDWDRLCALLAAQEPEWEPGTAHGESALFYGHLVGEVMRRVDGRRPGQFLREELGLDFYFGHTPAEQRRAVELTGFDTFVVEGAPAAADVNRRARTNPPGAFDPLVVNSAAWRAAEVPAVNGHGTARGVASLYAALLQGNILSPGLLAEATTAQCSGTDMVFGHENAWGLGFGVDADGFGMGGSGGSYGGASVVGRYAIAFLTGSMGSFDRVERLENTLRSCLDLPDL